MQISATTNADDLKRRLNNTFARQLPFATARALTATAHDMRKAERGHMARIFDRPTNWTLNAFEVVPAQRKDPVPTAEVRFKYTGSRVHYLQRHIEGGPRELAASRRASSRRHGRTIRRARPSRGSFRRAQPSWIATATGAQASATACSRRCSCRSIRRQTKRRPADR